MMVGCACVKTPNTINIDPLISITPDTKKPNQARRLGGNCSLPDANDVHHHTFFHPFIKTQKQRGGHQHSENASCALLWVGMCVFILIALGTIHIH